MKVSTLGKIKYNIDRESKEVYGKVERFQCGGIIKELAVMMPKRLQKWVGRDIPVLDICTFGNTFEAKAVAQESDKFDEKVGKSIVAKKLNYKFHDSMARRYRVIIRELTKALQIVRTLEAEHRKEADKNDEALAKYL